MASIEIGPFVVDEKPAQLVYQYLDYNGAAIDLTGYAVDFTWRERFDAVAQTAAGVLVNAALGEVGYLWTGGEFSYPGHYSGQFWVGNGLFRFASVLITFDVATSVAPAPAI